MNEGPVPAGSSDPGPGAPASQFHVVDTGKRLELVVDGQRAELVYELDGDLMTIVHTSVPEQIANHGLAGLLVQAAVEKARVNGLTVVPFCPYARAWLKQHPDEAQSIDVDWKVGRS